MRLTTRRKFEAARSALAFCQAHPDPNPVAAAWVSRLEELLEAMCTWVVTEGSCQKAMAEARGVRDAIHAGIRTRLVALVRFTVLVADQEGNAALALRLPRDTRAGRVNLLDELRRALIHVRRQEELFRGYGLPDDLLGELEGDLLRHELAERRRTLAEAQGSEAAGAITSLAEEVHLIVRHLGALNRIRFAADPAALAAWRAESAVVAPRAGAPWEAVDLSRAGPAAPRLTLPASAAPPGHSAGPS